MPTYEKPDFVRFNKTQTAAIMELRLGTTSGNRRDGFQHGSCQPSSLRTTAVMIRCLHGLARKLRLALRRFRFLHSLGRRGSAIISAFVRHDRCWS